MIYFNDVDMSYSTPVGEDIDLAKYAVKVELIRRYVLGADVEDALKTLGLDVKG